jgi:hypothetical protein
VIVFGELAAMAASAIDRGAAMEMSDRFKAKQPLVKRKFSGARPAPQGWRRSATRFGAAPAFFPPVIARHSDRTWQQVSRFPSMMPAARNFCSYQLHRAPSQYQRVIPASQAAARLVATAGNPYLLTLS